MISLENVSKKFGTGVFGISDITFSIEKGEFVFLIGPTGSGKTTILRMLIRESVPTQGTIVVDGWNLTKLPGRKIPELRKKIGVIFQDLKLLTDRTILENTSLPLEVSGINVKEARRRSEEILAKVGILEHKDKFPIQLSGGELQRAAIARALILSPEILLADEPTGNLDDSTAWEIVKLLSDINEGGTTIIMATHNSEIIKKLNKRIIELNKGQLINDKKKSHSDHEKHEHDKKPHESLVEDVEHRHEDKPASDSVNVDKSKQETVHEHSQGGAESEKETIKTDDFEEALKEEDK